MQKVISSKNTILIIVIILVISITGCQSKGLASYQEALETTNSIEKSEVKIEVDAKLNFDKTGLSFEEEKKLNDYEIMSGSITSKYDMTKELMETNMYYIQGGMGIDSSLFYKDQQLILQLPIINLFMILTEEDIMNVEDKEEIEESRDLSINFDKIMKDWISVFKEEDVVVGKNTYILTNEGQLKTTKYVFKLNSEQLKTLETQLFSEIDMEELNALIVSQISNYNESEEEVVFNIEEVLDKIELSSIEGEAFVDFDNRLIRQNFILKGNGINVKPGDLEIFEINLSITYSNLGDEQDFKFPTLTEENVVDQEELNDLFDMFNK